MRRRALFLCIFISKVMFLLLLLTLPFPLISLYRNRSPSTISLLPDDVTEHHPRLEESFTIHLGMLNYRVYI